MGRRTNRNAPSARRRRKGPIFEMPAVDVAWDAQIAYRDWLDELDREPESLTELLADDQGIDPPDLDETEQFESFMDAMGAEAWKATAYRRTVN